MYKLLKLIRFGILILFLLFFAGAIFIWQGIYLAKNSHSQEKIVFNVQKGDGATEIACNLAKQGIIKDPLSFLFYIYLKGVFRGLQPGVYQLSPSMNIPQIIAQFIKGNPMSNKITIIEGWNLKDIAQYLDEKGIVKSDDFLKAVKEDFSNDFDFLKEKPQNLSLEGYLFPDTYEIKKDASAEEITKKMLKNFEKKLVSYRDEISSQGKTIFEIITMASLIEKEVRTMEDKEIVSGILWKRLKNNMPLQVDATISYITGKKTTAISFEDLKIDSRYNTYKYRGLPSGPICNPGWESIKAAIYPKESDYWYYLSDKEGRTIFSKTLQEHNIAKEKYLKVK